MELFKYIRSLLPRITKDRVLEDSRIIRTELETVTIPSYKEAEKVFHSWKFKSPKSLELIKVFDRNVKRSGSDNVITVIRKGLEDLLEVHESTEERLRATLEADVISDGISCLKANLLRITETISFISKYAVDFLNYIYILETSAYAADDAYVRDSLPPAAFEKLDKNFIEFCYAFNALTISKQNFDKIIEEIPDIAIDTGTGEVMTATLGSKKTDPLNMSNFSVSVSNPIYHFGLMVAEWQANSYKRSKETKKILELRLLNLQLLKEKNADASLEKEIDYIQGRIQTLDFKLAKMEESVQ